MPNDIYLRAPKVFLTFSRGIAHFKRRNSGKTFVRYIFKCKPLQGPAGADVKEWTWIKLPKNTFNYELHLLSETELFLQFDDNGDDDDGGMMMMMIIQMFVHCILQFSGFILQTSRRFRLRSREAAPRPLRSHPESWTENKWGKGLKIPLQEKGGDVHHICD